MRVELKECEEERGEREREIERKKIRRVLKSLKKGKASGIDEIPNEALKFRGEKMEDWLLGFCNGIWKGEK